MGCVSPPGYPWKEFARVNELNASCEGDGCIMASISAGGADREDFKRGGRRGEALGVKYAFADSATTEPTSFVMEAETPLACILSTASGCCAWLALWSCCRDACIS